MERLRTSVKGGVDYHPYLPREDGRLPMSDFGSVHRYNVTGLYHDMWGFPTGNPAIVDGLIHHLTDKIRKQRRYDHQVQRVLPRGREDHSHILRFFSPFGVASR